MALTLWHFGGARPIRWRMRAALAGRRRLLAVALAMSTLASCALGPDFKSPPRAAGVRLSTRGQSAAGTDLRARRGHPPALVGAVPVAPPERPRRDGDRPQHRPAGCRSRRAGGAGQRAGSARGAVPPGRGQLELEPPADAGRHAAIECRQQCRDLLPAHRPGNGRLRAGRVGRNAPPDRVAGGTGRSPGLPARGRLSHAHGQHRARRHPGGLAARPDRGHPPVDLAADAAARDPAPAEQPGPDRAARRARAGDCGWRRRACCCRRSSASSNSSATCSPPSPGASRARRRPPPSSSARSACRGSCRSACPPISYASAPTCARPRPTCTRPTPRSA